MSTSKMKDYPYLFIAQQREMFSFKKKFDPKGFICSESVFYIGNTPEESYRITDLEGGQEKLTKEEVCLCIDAMQFAIDTGIIAGLTPKGACLAMLRLIEVPTNELANLKKVCEKVYNKADEDDVFLDPAA